jgi:hypothetical protein
LGSPDKARAGRKLAPHLKQIRRVETQWPSARNKTDEQKAAPIELPASELEAMKLAEGQ